MGLIHNAALRTVVLRRAELDPRTIPGLGLWLRADTAYTSVSPDVQATGTDSIRRWPDLSGNGRHFGQTSGGNKPAWSAAGANGRPGINGDGFDDYLTAEAGNDLLNNVAGVTMFAVGAGSSATVSSSQQLFAVANSSGPSRATLNRDATNTYTAGGRRLDANSFAGTSGGTTSTNLFIQAGVLDYASAIATLYLNGSALSTLNPFQTAGNTSATDSAAIRVFSGPGTPVNFFPGLLAEVLVWRRVLTAAERNQVISYLGRRYSVSVTV